MYRVKFTMKDKNTITVIAEFVWFFVDVVHVKGSFGEFRFDNKDLESVEVTFA